MLDEKAMFRLSYGLYILTAREGDNDNGCIINTVTQVTAEPKQIAVAVNKQNYTHGMILRTGQLNVSVLTTDSRFQTYRHWGFQSGAHTDKLEGIEYQRAENGIVYIVNECNAYLSAKVVSVTDLGTHSLFLAEVTEATVLAEADSVTYDYYQKNIKESPKQREPQKGFLCTVCGYIYEGDVLPEDFICPWCKHPASDFVPLPER